MSDKTKHILIAFLILIYSSIFHECAHGFVAYALGDPTAYNLGRITLNPVPHIDPVWSIIIPLATYFVSRGTFIFGGANPVPIDLSYFTHPNLGFMLSSIAGPATNFILASLGLLGFMIALRIRWLNVFAQGSNRYFWHMMIKINILLAAFNLIPIPPLDGSRVVRFLLPGNLKLVFDGIESFGFVIIIIFIMTGGTRFIYRLLDRIDWFLISLERRY